MNITPQQEMYAQVIQKCWEDESFKNELLANPLEVIENFLGAPLDIPEGKTLVVNDQTDRSTLFINLRNSEQARDVELSQQQLETVTAGVRDYSKYVLSPVIVCFPEEKSNQQNLK